MAAPWSAVGRATFCHSWHQLLQTWCESLLLVVWNCWRRHAVVRWRRWKDGWRRRKVSKCGRLSAVDNQTLLNWIMDIKKRCRIHIWRWLLPASFLYSNLLDFLYVSNTLECLFAWKILTYLVSFTVGHALSCCCWNVLIFCCNKYSGIYLRKILHRYDNYGSSFLCPKRHNDNMQIIGSIHKSLCS